MTTKAIEAGARAIRDVWHKHSHMPTVPGEEEAKACIEAAIASGELVPASVTKPYNSAEFLTSPDALDEYVKEMMASAVAAERERCAIICDEQASRSGTKFGDPMANYLAAVIRALEPASGEYVLVPRAALAVVIRKIEWFDDKAGYQSRELEQAINDIETPLITAATSNGSGK